MIGIVKIVQSAKMTMVAIVVAVSSAALLLNKLDGPSYAAVIGVVMGAGLWAHSATERAAINMNLPPKGQ